MCSTCSCSCAAEMISEQKRPQRAWRAGWSCLVQALRLLKPGAIPTPAVSPSQEDGKPDMFHIFLMPSLTSCHSDGRAFLQGSLEGLKPKDLSQCFPDPAFQARGSLAAHLREAVNSDRNQCSTRMLSPSSGRGLPRLVATRATSPMAALPGSPLFLAPPPQDAIRASSVEGTPISFILRQTPTKASPWGAGRIPLGAEEGHSGGGDPAAPQTLPHPDMVGGDGTRRGLSHPHPPPHTGCILPPPHVPSRPLLAPAPTLSRLVRVRQLLSRRRVMTSETALKGATPPL